MRVIVITRIHRMVNLPTIPKSRAFVIYYVTWKQNNHKTTAKIKTSESSLRTNVQFFIWKFLQQKSWRILLYMYQKIWNL